MPVNYVIILSLQHLRKVIFYAFRFNDSYILPITPSDVVVYVPEGAIKDYWQAGGWCHFHNFREMSSGVGEIAADCDARPADISLPGLYLIVGRKVLVK